MIHDGFHVVFCGILLIIASRAHEFPQLAKDISSTKLWRKIYAINGKRPDNEDLADIKFRKVTCSSSFAPRATVTVHYDVMSNRIYVIIVCDLKHAFSTGLAMIIFTV